MAYVWGTSIKTQSPSQVTGAAECYIVRTIRDDNTSSDVAQLVDMICIMQQYKGHQCVYP